MISLLVRKMLSDLLDKMLSWALLEVDFLISHERENLEHFAMRLVPNEWRDSIVFRRDNHCLLVRRDNDIHAKGQNRLSTRKINQGETYLENRKFSASSVTSSVAQRSPKQLQLPSSHVVEAAGIINLKYASSSSNFLPEFWPGKRKRSTTSLVSRT
jgi:hypothetical protein